MPKGGKHGNIPASRSAAYEDLRQQGMGKSKAARIAWKGRTLAGRKSMARAAARTRKARGR